jgi:ABC-type transport system involved in multi-copper enzyme maturation permease subunit
MASLLHYRSWQGRFHSPWWSIWPIARVALATLLRHKLFWTLYGFGLFLFLMFFFGNYLLGWADTQMIGGGEQFKRFGDLGRLLRGGVRRLLHVLNGSQDTYQYFFAYQGAIVIVTLALAGAVLVGNDFTFRSLTFYLAKPISRWHYILGKCLAVMLVVQMMTTLPALGLYAQHAFDDFEYFLNVHYFTDTDTGNGPAGLVLLGAIVAYGTLLSVFLSILLVATASWMRRTMPLIMVWVSLFFFLRLLANRLVDGLKYDERWRLIDLWNDLSLLGQACLGYAHERVGNQPQPEFWEAGVVLAGVCIVCLIYLNHRTRGVEIVR